MTGSPNKKQSELKGKIPHITEVKEATRSHDWYSQSSWPISPACNKANIRDKTVCLGAQLWEIFNLLLLGDQTSHGDSITSDFSGCKMCCLRFWFLLWEEKSLDVGNRTGVYAHTYDLPNAPALESLGSQWLGWDCFFLTTRCDPTVLRLCLLFLIVSIWEITKNAVSKL